MKRFSFFIFFLLSPLSAHDFFEDNYHENAIVEVVECGTGVEENLKTRENYFLTSTEFRIPLKVNPITGEYCEEEKDFVVAGSEALSLRRFYNSFAPHNLRYGMWRYNPESMCVGNLEWKRQEIFASVGDEDGSVSSLKQDRKNSLFYYVVPSGFQTLKNDGQCHPLNTKIHYQRITKRNDKHCFRYEGTISDGSGRKRTFITPHHFWKDTISIKRWGRTIGIKTKVYDVCSPDTWTPYQLPIVEERLPNGNVLCYRYTTWKKEKNYPLPQLLESITAYSADKSQILGKIELGYPRARDGSITGIEVKGSDQRSFLIKHSTPHVQLIHAQGKGSPSAHYDYNDNALTRVTRPEGRIITTEYNSDKKVSAQYAPVGPHGEMHPIARYSYNHYMTQLMDAEGERIDYHFDSASKKLKAINYLKHCLVYRADHFTSDPHTGNLTSKITKDGQGRTLQVTEYQYDGNQNPTVIVI